MKKTGLNRYVYDFSVDYNAKMFGFIKKCFFKVMTFFSYNVLNVNSLKCVSMNTQE